MKKANMLVLLGMLMFLLTGCATNNIDHSDKSVVPMKVENKTVDKTYIANCDDHYNIVLSHNGSKYILKNENIFNNVKESETIDVLYVMDYDSKNNLLGVHIEPITQSKK